MNIARINELARLSKTRELTIEEKEEQAKLRKEYIEEFRANLRGQLDNIDIKMEDGTVVSAADIRKKKLENK